MKLKLLITLLFFGISLNANESTIYLTEIKSHIPIIEEFKKSLIAGDKKFCPNSTGDLQSDCISNYLNNAKIKSSTEITLLAVVIVGAAENDKKKGSPADSVKISMIQNLILMMEKVDIKNFYLSQKKDNTEIDLLRKDDEKMLSELKTKLLSKLSKPLQDISANPANKTLADQLDKRIEKLKEINWKY